MVKIIYKSLTKYNFMFFIFPRLYFVFPLSSYLRLNAEIYICYRRTSPLISPGSGRTSPSKKKKLIVDVKKSPILKDRAIQSDLSESGMNLQENGIDQITGVPSPRTASISDPVRHEPQVWRWVSLSL